METRKALMRWILQFIALLFITLSLTGCLFNFLQTARTIGAGEAALTLGLGAIMNAEYVAYLAPQGRLTVGMTEGIDLGFQSGVRIGMGPAAGDVKFLGAVGDLKFSLLDGPQLLMAAGVGGGYSHDAYRDKNGWGLSLSAYCEPVFPHLFDLSCCAGYRLHLPLGESDESDRVPRHQLAFSISFILNDQARLILEFNRLPFEDLTSLGLAVEVTAAQDDTHASALP